jgi:hypothetical protein
VADAGEKSDAGKSDAGKAGDAGHDASVPPPMPTPIPACTSGLHTFAVDTAPDAFASFYAFSTSPASPVYATATPDGNIAIAWTGQNGARITTVDRTGKRVGGNLAAAGTSVHGLAATADGFALLVARDPGAIDLVKVDLAGPLVFDTKILGSDGTQVGDDVYSYYLGFDAQGGRLGWDGSQYVAYFQMFHHYPDGVSHTGDTLRYFSASGAAGTLAWNIGAGCSHSLDLRLALGPAGLATTCVSDCYPSKGVLFDHSAVVSSEPSGNCMGSSDARLGGFVAVADGYWLTYLSNQGRDSLNAALVHLGTGGPTGAPRWLTNTATATSHLARFGQGLLAEASPAMGGAAGTLTLFVLDASGAPVGDPVSVVAGTNDRDDWMTLDDGSVAWVGGGKSGGLALYRFCP